jgi:hypothetical protein
MLYTSISENFHSVEFSFSMSHAANHSAGPATGKGSGPPDRQGSGKRRADESFSRRDEASDDDDTVCTHSHDARPSPMLHQMHMLHTQCPQRNRGCMPRGRVAVHPCRKRYARAPLPASLTKSEPKGTERNREEPRGTERNREEPQRLRSLRSRSDSNANSAFLFRRKTTKPPMHVSLT